jgi:23S rRNA (cytosine1962-C5)-methyltransferase
VEVLFEDEHLLAVNKPEGLPTHAPSEGVDNLISRLQAQRPGLRLGVHQRLDAVTSGLLVFSKTPAAAKGLAAQFEGRTVRKTYLAVVCGDYQPPSPSAGAPQGTDGRSTLTHWLTRQGERVRADTAEPPPARGAPSRGAPSARGPARASDAQRAVTEVEVLERCAPLTRLLLSPLTGRTHQLRAQLAAVGHPILGDALYGGGQGPGRVLLHAWRLSLRHPVSGEPCELEAPAPPALASLTSVTLWRSLLPVQLGARRAPATGAGADAEAYLEADAADDADDADAADDAYALAVSIPDVRAERFGEWGVLHAFAGGGVEDVSGWRSLAQAWGQAQGLRGVCLKAHIAHDPQRGSRDLDKPTQTLWGSDLPDAPFAVTEHGVRYLIDLQEQHGCGLYLDQRHNRRWLIDLVRAKAARGEAVEVLNLFAYTCSFSAAAAAAGAHRVTSVDVSKRALAWGRRNLEANGVDPAAHAFYPDDVQEALARAQRRGARFDVIVCDPPSFGRGRKGAALHQEVSALVEASAGLLNPGGWLLACLNHRATSGAQLEARVREGLRRAGREVAAWHVVPTPTIDDTPSSGTALKTLRVQVRGEAP